MKGQERRYSAWKVALAGLCLEAALWGQTSLPEVDPKAKEVFSALEKAWLAEDHRSIANLLNPERKVHLRLEDRGGLLSKRQAEGLLEQWFRETVQKSLSEPQYKTSEESASVQFSCEYTKQGLAKRAKLFVSLERVDSRWYVAVLSLQ